MNLFFIRVKFYLKLKILTHSAASSTRSTIVYLDILFRESGGPKKGPKRKELIERRSRK